MVQRFNVNHPWYFAIYLPGGIGVDRFWEQDIIKSLSVPFPPPPPFPFPLLWFWFGFGSGWFGHVS